jgi:hypothetical protein
MHHLPDMGARLRIADGSSPLSVADVSCPGSLAKGPDHAL